MSESGVARLRRPQEDPLGEAPIACHELDMEGRVIWVNEAECRLLGLAPECILGRPIWEFVAPREQRDSQQAVFQKLASEEPLSVFERSYIRPDNTSLVLEIYDQYRYDEKGHIVGIRSFLLDITARKRAEEELLRARQTLETSIRERTQELELAIQFLQREMEERQAAQNEQRRLEAQMQQAQRMESVGVLAGGVAHEFNNLLTSIMGYASMAELETPEGSHVRENIAQVIAAARSAADLTRQMLAYSGRGRFVLEPLDLSTTVENTARLLDSTASKKAEVVLHLERNLPRIEADVGQVRQIVINLATNASEALGDQQGQIAVATGMHWAAAGELPSLVAGRPMPPGLYVYLEVSDTGCGMDAATLQRIFDPFFTTKFPGRGLGLAAVQGIVRSHQGSIVVTSAPGKGTTMRVLFPARSGSEPAAAEAPLDDGDPLHWRSTGMVLVVEDEEPVRKLARAILEAAGLTVLTAESGVQGVALFREHATDLRAVLLDLTMPGMDGAEVLRAIVEFRPDAPVVLCSGYNEQEIAAEVTGYQPAGFLRKPYLAAELIRQIRAIW
jgi:two-component system cell cycle sensor histidine kinase/response regulator CckA